MGKEKGTKDNPWTLKTPPGTSEFTMYKEETLNPPVLVCTVGKPFSITLCAVYRIYMLSSRNTGTGWNWAVRMTKAGEGGEL